MGQKVNPIGLRIGINKTWGSRWYVDPKEYANTLHEDLKLRKLILDMPETKGADIAELEIIRHPQRITITIHTARPGVIIGVKGANIEKIGAELQKQVNKKIQIKIKEIRNADGNAQGIKIRLSGRLGGAEMSRTEESKEGRIPLHTLRADIDYGFAEAHTTFGSIGVKVWVYNGMKYGKEQKEDAGVLVRKRRERVPAGSRG